MEAPAGVCGYRGDSGQQRSKLRRHASLYVRWHLSPNVCLLIDEANEMCQMIRDNRKHELTKSRFEETIRQKEDRRVGDYNCELLNIYE